MKLDIAVALALLWGVPARASNYALEEIPQLIPAAEAQKLKAAGVTTTFQLLERGADPKRRRQLALKAKVPDKTLSDWAQLADIMRIKGVGPDVGRLLGAAG